MKITDVERKEVKKVLKGFNSEKRKTKEEIFYDLCFCICAPQTTFISNNKVQKALREADFYREDIPLEKLHEMVKPARFFRMKSQRLIEAKELFNTWLYGYVKERLDLLSRKHPSLFETELRDALEYNVKGLGMKAASHLCRNLGCTEVAIIDTHVLKFMGLNLSDISSRTKYAEVEEKFKAIAKECGMSSVELDAWIWKKYSNTSWDDFIY